MWSSAATPDAIVLASNSALSGRDKFFMRDDTLLCAHAGLFDETSVLVMRSSKNPGRELDACSVEVVPQVTKVRGPSPGGRRKAPGKSDRVENVGVRAIP